MKQMIRILAGMLLITMILLGIAGKYALSLSEDNAELKTSNDMLATSLANESRRRIELDKLAVDRDKINRRLRKEASEYENQLKNITDKTTIDYLNQPIPTGL